MCILPNFEAQDLKKFGRNKRMKEAQAEPVELIVAEQPLLENQVSARFIDSRKQASLNLHNCLFKKRASFIYQKVGLSNHSSRHAQKSQKP